MVEIHFTLPVYWEYCKYFGTINTPSTRSTRRSSSRSTNRTKYCQYLAAPAVQIPQILGSAAVFHKQSIVQKYWTPKYYGYGTIGSTQSQYKYCEYSRYLNYFLSEIISISPGTGSICEGIHLQIDGPSSGKSSKFLSRGTTGVLGVC